MKKIMFIAAVAAMTLASCAKNEVIQNTTDQNAISFSTYVGNAPVSKAADMDVTDLHSNGFYAVAYNTGAGDGTTNDWVASNYISVVPNFPL